MYEFDHIGPECARLLESWRVRDVRYGRGRVTVDSVASILAYRRSEVEALPPQEQGVAYRELERAAALGFGLGYTRFERIA